MDRRNAPPKDYFRAVPRPHQQSLRPPKPPLRSCIPWLPASFASNSTEVFRGAIQASADPTLPLVGRTPNAAGPQTGQIGASLAPGCNDWSWRQKTQLQSAPLREQRDVAAHCSRMAFGVSPNPTNWQPWGRPDAFILGGRQRLLRPGQPPCALQSSAARRRGPSLTPHRASSNRVVVQAALLLRRTRDDSGVATPPPKSQATEL